MKRLLAALVAGFFVIGATNAMAQSDKKSDGTSKEAPKKKEKKGGC